MTFDPVNKPSHYTEGRQFETIEVIEDWKLSYRLGNCVKYISRAGRKGDRKQDLEKAAWYLQREIEAIDKPSQYAPPADVQYEDVLRPDGRVRIYELAHELGLSNREVLEACDSLEINVKSHFSSLCAESVRQIRAFLFNRGVQHEDVLEYYGQSIDLDEAWPFEACEEDCEEDPVWVTGWDDSLGPVEIEPEEIQERLAKKNLNQFADDEIVSTIERRGMIIGFRKDGTSCVLRDGRCE